MADEMKLQIITPVGRFYEGDVTMAELTTTEGNIGIYPNHIPLQACRLSPLHKQHFDW